MEKSAPVCKVCDNGTLVNKKQYRLSGPAVVIGYIFLIPSVIGILIGVFMLFGTGAATSKTAVSLEAEVREQLNKASIPHGIIETVIDNETVSEAQKSQLTADQITVLDDASLTYSTGMVGAGAGTLLAGGFSIFMIISSFVGGLIGWLLVMKKKVLKCSTCGAVVSAS